jgi:hypothetical protein
MYFTTNIPVNNNTINDIIFKMVFGCVNPGSMIYIKMSITDNPTNDTSIKGGKI